jgi:hypothetical protein
MVLFCFQGNVLAVEMFIGLLELHFKFVNLS